MMAGRAPVSVAMKATDRSRGRRVIRRSILQGLRVSSHNTVAPQGSRRPAVFCTVAVPKPGVIGCTVLQGLAILSGQLST